MNSENEKINVDRLINDIDNAVSTKEAESFLLGTPGFFYRDTELLKEFQNENESRYNACILMMKFLIAVQEKQIINIDDYNCQSEDLKRFEILMIDSLFPENEKAIFGVFRRVLNLDSQFCSTIEKEIKKIENKQLTQDSTPKEGVTPKGESLKNREMEITDLKELLDDLGEISEEMFSKKYYAVKE